MNILILGSGGRESTFAWKIAQSNLCDNLFIAPGNAGTSQYGKNINIKATDFDAVKNVVLEQKINLVLVGPEEPLVKGIHDYFLASADLKDIPVIGPKADGAQLEGSKDFSKEGVVREKLKSLYNQIYNKIYDDEIDRYVKSIRSVHSRISTRLKNQLKIESLAHKYGFNSSKTSRDVTVYNIYLSQDYLVLPSRLNTFKINT